MRRKRRPDLMTMLWWIAATGVALSSWAQAHAADLTDDPTAVDAYAHSITAPQRIMLNLGSATNDSTGATTGSWFISAGTRTSERVYDLNWHMARQAAPLIQLVPGDAYVLVGIHRTWR